jgi:hypothetical protein
MAAAKVERRVYPAVPLQIFGACLTALGQLHARIESQDVERGVITATVGAGPFVPMSELALHITQLVDGRTELVVRWRARRRGGDRRVLPTFVEAVGTLLAAG